MDVLLNTLKINEEGIIISIDNNNPKIRKRLLDMGLTKNTKVKIVGFSPLNDPVTISIRGYNLALRRSELSLIKVRIDGDNND